MLRDRLLAFTDMTIHLKKREISLLIAVAVGLTALAAALPHEQWGLGALVIVSALMSVAFSLEMYRRVFRLHEVSLQEFRQVQAWVSIVQTLKPSRPLPPLRGWAITPDLGLMLLSTVFEEKPTTIVECGSGTSTLLMAYALRELGAGHIYALEHDQPSKRRTEALLQTHELGAWATVLDAPLEKSEIKGEVFEWYDTAGLPAFEVIDLILVDGPPSFKIALARYPALPRFWAQLKSGGTLLLDDSDRPHERRVVERWKSEFSSANYRVEDTQRGTLVLRKN